jgi:HK97 family phage major capsid protein
MRHVDKTALLASATIIRKGDEDDPAGIVTKALEDLQKSVDDRLKTIETKGIDPKLADRLDKLEAKMNRPGSGDETKEPDAEQKAFGTYLRRGDAGLGDVERNALTVATDATAGFLAPTTFRAEILKKIREFSQVRQFAKVVQIGGRDVRYPRRIGSTVATWVDEVANRTESGPSFEQVTLTPYELATFVEVSRQLLEDNTYNLEGELAADLAESFAIAEGSAFVVGDGTGKPKGILYATGIAEVNSGAAATLGAAPGDTLINLFTALPTFYAQNAAWAMNRNTFATIRKVKDTTGNYLWQPSLQEGAPSTLLGRPVIEMVDMPDIGAGLYPIVFGDWSGYRIVDRIDMSILSDPYTRAKNGLNTFHARKRVGGDCTNPDRFVKLKIAV